MAAATATSVPYPLQTVFVFLNGDSEFDVKQVEQAHDETPAGNSAAVAQESAARFRFWLGCKKGGARRGLMTWRPKKFHRVSAKKWLRSVNNQFKVGTHTGGLQYFKYDPSISLWSDVNLKSWPYSMVCQDLGPDCTRWYFAGERKF